MNVLPNVSMETPEFLAWVQGREGRYELAERRVVMMTGGSRGHAIVLRRLASALEKRLDGDRWAVLTSDFGVEPGPRTIRYPDVVVDVAGGRIDDLVATAPTLIAEVVSPSSATQDLGDKAAEYLQLPSLKAYLVLSQDEPKVWAWVRDAAGFPCGPQVITGHDARIEIAALGVTLPLADIYAGLAER
ncbi:MAG: Uma2 family endonuclease [Xanthobacteraceae bacterium]|jgi:Uma2 family endonuclease